MASRKSRSICENDAGRPSARTPATLARLAAARVRALTVASGVGATAAVVVFVGGGGGGEGRRAARLIPRRLPKASNRDASPPPGDSPEHASAGAGAALNVNRRVVVALALALAAAARGRRREGSGGDRPPA